MSIWFGCLRIESRHASKQLKEAAKAISQLAKQRVLLVYPGSGAELLASRLVMKLFP